MTAAEPTRRPGLWRTALLLLPIQAVFRGGEAVLPLLLAAWFGRSAETDLYYLLAAYFVFAGSIVTGAFQDSAIVPVLVEAGERDLSELRLIAGSLLGHTLAVGGAVATVAMALAVAAALAFSRTPTLAIAIVVLMAWGLVATAVRAFYVGLLNARGRFSAHPVASGAGVALTIGLLAAGRGRLGVLVIPAALLAGEVTAFGLLSVFAARELGGWIAPHLGRPEPVRRIGRLVRLEVLGSAITRINPLIDQLATRVAGVVGGGTILLYATSVAGLPTSILQATLFPVFLTHLSREAARPRELLATTRRTVLAASLLLAGLAAAIALVRGPLCRTLFLHGAMDAAGAEDIARVLPFALLGVAPFGALLLLARAHVARQNSRIMPSMGLLNAACNAGLNLILVGPLGVGGIALSTSVTYAIVAAVFWVRLSRATSA